MPKGLPLSSGPRYFICWWCLNRLNLIMISLDALVVGAAASPKVLFFPYSTVLACRGWLHGNHFRRCIPSPAAGRSTGVCLGVGGAHVAGRQVQKQANKGISRPILAPECLFLHKSRLFSLIHGFKDLSKMCSRLTGSLGLHHTSTILLLKGSGTWEDVVGGSQDVLLSAPSHLIYCPCWAWETACVRLIAGSCQCTSSTTSTSRWAAVLGVANNDLMLKGWLCQLHGRRWSPLPLLYWQA